MLAEPPSTPSHPVAALGVSHAAGDVGMDMLKVLDLFRAPGRVGSRALGSLFV